ncbi:ankyrin repeat domain-containing protein [Streptomyces sp. NPDC048603]|uniref:ankyrin repeat domain-containing protein n=1 Tax=Streptomyces sp. NPDC048603 TaxID=3365577 RepID=UPI00371F8CF1
MNRRRQKKLTRALLLAVWTDDAGRVRALLRAGADPATPAADGITPLYAASVHGAADAVRLLLAAGAPPNSESGGTGSEGTPLCAAASWGHTDAVRELLAHGADPTLREDGGTGLSPLDWALLGPHPETAALLRAAGAGPRPPGALAVNRNG